uniref:Golgi apparatus membrane protein TVP23 homolog n=1 Tax=Ciona savignyi TaxID=51511 RepID=H2Y6Y1_CIOSA
MSTDTVLEFGSENEPKLKKRILHPAACFFHLFFRVSALIVYLICGLTTAGFVSSFIIIILLLSADFWTVKNVTGRLLVGLRWWNKVDEDGKSTWIYEARNATTMKKYPVKPAESRIFWVSLIVCPLIWLFSLFGLIFGLNVKWLAVVIVALTLNCANLFGYIRCKFTSRKQIGSLATQYIGGQLFKSMSETNEDNPHS